jgi:hypothetical protein
MRRRSVVKSKSGKIVLGMVILIFAATHVFTLAHCLSDYIEIRQPGHDHHHTQIHCGVDITSFVTSDDRSSSFADLTFSLGSLSRITEPRLPILSFSVFKVPKPVQTPSFV